MKSKFSHPLFVLSFIFSASALACSSVAFAQESPRPLSAPNGETARELKAVTHGKAAQKSKPVKAKRPQKRARYNPEDVGC